MLEVTETEETIVLFVTFFIIGSISTVGPGPLPPPPLATPMGCTTEPVNRNVSALRLIRHKMNEGTLN